MAVLSRMVLLNFGWLFQVVGLATKYWLKLIFTKAYCRCSYIKVLTNNLTEECKYLLLTAKCRTLQKTLYIATIHQNKILCEYN